MNKHWLSRGKLISLFCIVPLVLTACGGGSSTPAVSATNSIITATPSTVTADGKAAATITVTLLDANARPYTGGANVSISANPCTGCKLHYAKHNGKVTGTLRSTVPENPTLSFAINGATSPNTATVDFSTYVAPPNIVLIITDDIGIDQWKLFGYGGLTPAPTPNLDAIAQAGLKFHNMWSMPACSNGRATIFTGRWPLRTHVLTAIGGNDLANYMVNPNEMTLPDLLKTRGYKSALFGKFHMGEQGNDPYGYAMVHALGFDYFAGFLDAAGNITAIDTTAGGVSPAGTWSCGFVRDAAHGGADQGACYAGDGTCQEMIKSGAEAPGRICRDSGGIFDPNKSCQNPVPSYINFNTLGGYYVNPLVINNADGSVEQVPPTDIRARTFRDTEIVNAASDWINQQPANQPWMVTLAFASVHTPVMQPPRQLLPSTYPDTSNLDCSRIIDQRILTNELERSNDTSIGNFMVNVGLATRDANGKLVYNPKANNTYIIYIADNGSLGFVVKAPFSIARAKSTPYQTGVWVPGIVAGPNVNQPGRQTNAMVNGADLFQLVGELAGINVHKTVPRTLDSQSMLPYLENPNQPEIRTTNFTEIGTNLQANGKVNGPCVIQGVCTQIAADKSMCHDNNGQWWGAAPDATSAPPAGFALCCEAEVWQHDNNYTPQINSILASHAIGMRNDNYKLVVNNTDSYDAATNACAPTTSTEFYQINENVPLPKLDRTNADLIAPGAPPLTPEQQQNYDALTTAYDNLLASQPACPADINLDGVVDQKDVDQYEMFKQLSDGKSSWADINQDGLTNQADLDIIEQDFGPCPTSSNAAEKSNRKR